MKRIAFVLAIFAFAISGIVHAQDSVFLSDDATAAGLELTEVASDLEFPMGMVALSDGSILVATSPSQAGNFYDSTGEIIRMVDQDGDGTFDDRSTVASGLPGSLVALAKYEDIVVTTSAEGGDEAIIFFRTGSTWDQPLIELDRLQLGFIGAMHQSYALAIRPSKSSDDSFDLFFNLGAGGNDTDGANVRLSGPLSDSLEPSSVHMITVTFGGSELRFSDPVLIATGLRNASVLLIHPETGDLLIGENGIDGLEEAIVAYSADEINVVSRGQIGVKIVDFGFPDAYTESATGVAIGVQTALITFLPIAGDEAEGIAGMTLLPASFPGPFSGQLIAGFHGQFDLIGIKNEENPVRIVNLETGDQSNLILNSSQGVGHIDSMISTDDAVFLADFCADSLTNSAGCGAIYRLAIASD